MPSSQSAGSPSLLRHLTIALKHLQQHGFRYSAGCLFREIRFDLKNGVDTTTLETTAPVPYAVSYQGADPGAVVQLLKALPSIARHSHFLDYGCGKGRALILAREHGFKELTGIEINPLLLSICKNNLSKASHGNEIAKIGFFEGDASTFEPPAGAVTAFFYNPFSGPPLQEVAQRLKDNARRSGADVWVIYVNPLHLEVFGELGFRVTYSLQHRKTTTAVIAHWHPEASSKGMR